MAIRETLVLTRPNATIDWPWEVLPPSSNTDTSTLFSVEIVEDDVTSTRVRTWHNNTDFVNEKSKQTTVTSNKQYFNYIIDNNIKVVRTIEVI